MIDLHCHLLPGLDDGPATLDASLELARAAEAAGIGSIAATPHIREDYAFDLGRIDSLVGEVNRACEADGLSVRATTGGELALTRVSELTDDEISTIALGGGPYVLVESPYMTMTDLLAAELFNLQVRGFRPLLAHPERSPSLAQDLDMLRGFVDRGVLCSITADSMAGRFGRTVQTAAAAMLRGGLVHNVASDAHGASGRGPALLHGFEKLEGSIRGITQQAAWYTRDVPRAILAGEDLPPRPAGPKRGGILRRRRGGGA